jgi:hypothetical protein
MAAGLPGTDPPLEVRCGPGRHRSHDPGTAQRLDGEALELEGHPLIPIETGHTDTAGTTSLHAPSIGLIAAGDVVYNHTHPYQAESTPHTRLEWIAALDKLEALEPARIAD